MKINQSKEFAEDTRNSNSAIINFAIREIIKWGYNWEYDVYFLEANSYYGTISGTSASMLVYLSLMSSYFPYCFIPKKLAVTGVLDLEKSWRGDCCFKCKKRSEFYHFIYNKNSQKLDLTMSNAVDSNSQLVFCNEKCFQQWKLDGSYWQEPKIQPIGGLFGKISATVKNGCDTIIIPADNLTDYYSEVPSNTRSKVKSVQTVANYKELQKIIDNWKK